MELNLGVLILFVLVFGLTGPTIGLSFTTNQTKGPASWLQKMTDAINQFDAGRIGRTTLVGLWLGGYALCRLHEGVWLLNSQLLLGYCSFLTLALIAPRVRIIRSQYSIWRHARRTGNLIQLIQAREAIKFQLMAVAVLTSFIIVAIVTVRFF